jgi:hypothetical protein
MLETVETDTIATDTVETDTVATDTVATNTIATDTVEPKPAAPQANISQALIPWTSPVNRSLVTSSVPTLEQVQCEATVDLLLLGIHFDRGVGANELEFLQAEIATLPWDEFYSPSIYLQRVTPLIRVVVGHPEKRARLLRDISQRMADVEVMKFAIERFSTLLTLGGRVAIEGILLDQVMEIFFAEA